MIEGPAAPSAVSALGGSGNAAAEQGLGDRPRAWPKQQMQAARSGPGRGPDAQLRQRRLVHGVGRRDLQIDPARAEPAALQILTSAQRRQPGGDVHSGSNRRHGRFGCNHLKSCPPSAHDVADFARHLVGDRPQHDLQRLG